MWKVFTINKRKERKGKEKEKQNIKKDNKKVLLAEVFADSREAEIISRKEQECRNGWEN